MVYYLQIGLSSFGDSIPDWQWESNMADEQEEAISEEISTDTAESTEDAEDRLGRLEDEIGRLQFELDRCRAEHDARLSAIETGAGGYAAAEHEHDYAGREHEHAGTSNNEHDAGSHQETREESGSETAPRSSHPYYRPIRELFSK